MDFPDRLLKLQVTQETTDNTDTQNTDELLMHETVFLNEKNILPETRIFGISTTVQATI